MAVGYCKHVSISIIGVAYSALGGSVACDSAHCIIEDLSDLTASVGDLFANVQLVIAELHRRKYKFPYAAIMRHREI